MDDFLKDLKFAVNDRLRSPILGTFLISWISWNFSTVILVFGSGEFDKKIIMLEKLYPSNFSYFWQGLVYPFASASAFVLIYPFIARWTFLYWIKQLKKTKEKQTKIDDETPLTLEDIQELKKSFYDRSRNQEIEIDRLHRNNQQQKSDIKELESLINQHLDNLISKDSEIAKLNSSLNQLIAEVSEKNKTLDEMNKKTVQLNTSKLRTTLIESLNSKSEDIELQKFLNELGLQDEELTNKLSTPLLKIKNFKNKNNLNIDELKTIIYVFAKGGKAPIEDLGNFLDLSDINVEIIINRLVKNKFCTLNDEFFLELTTSTNNSLYEFEITKIKDPILAEIVKKIDASL